MKVATLREEGPMRPTDGPAHSAPPILEPWYTREEVSTGAHIDARMRLAEYFGWEHRVGVSGESSEQVVLRARKFPARNSIITGELSGVARQYVSQLAAEDAGLFVVLERYDFPGSQVLHSLMHRPPWSLGAQMLRHRLPDYAELGSGPESLRHALIQLFVGMPFGARARLLAWLSAEDKRALAKLLRKRGLRSEARIRQGLFVLAVAYWMNEFGVMLGDAVTWAGGKSAGHADVIESGDAYECRKRDN